MRHKLTKTEKFLLLTVLIVASLYFYVNKFYDPAMARFENCRQEAVQLQEEIDKIGGPGAELALTKKVGKLRSEVRELEQKVANQTALKKEEDQPGVTRHLALLIQLVPQYNLDIIKLGSGDLRESSNNPAQPIEAFSWWEHNLQFDGDYSNLVRYLGKLADMDQTIVIEEIAVKETKEKEDGYQLSLKLLI